MNIYMRTGMNLTQTRSQQMSQRDLGYSYSRGSTEIPACSQLTCYISERWAVNGLNAALITLQTC